MRFLLTSWVVAITNYNHDEFESENEIKTILFMGNSFDFKSIQFESDDDLLVSGGNKSVSLSLTVTV